MNSILDGYLTGWNAGNIDGLDAVLAPNFHRVAPAVNSNDLAEMKKGMTDFPTAYPVRLGAPAPDGRSGAIPNSYSDVGGLGPLNAHQSSADVLCASGVSLGTD